MLYKGYETIWKNPLHLPVMNSKMDCMRFFDISQGFGCT